MLLRVGCAAALYITGTLFGAVAQESTAANPPSDNNAKGTRAQPLLEEVIVTARRREESLQETPVAVSALSSKDLLEAGISNLVDLEAHAPSLSISGNNDKSPKIFIRGVGQRQGLDLFDPAVGVYLNEILIPRSVGQLLETVDVESVQVLRGPQGTLFGKNNAGGAILFRTVKPDLQEADGSLALRYGNFGHFDTKITGNLPLIEGKMGARVALSSTRRKGFMENIVEDDGFTQEDETDDDMFGDEDRLGASARFLWDVSDDFTVDVFGFWSRTDEKNQGVTCVFQNPDASLPNLTFPQQPPFDPSCLESEALFSDRKLAVNQDQSVFEVENSMLALTLDWRINDNLYLTSITGYSRFDNVSVNNDFDGTRAIIVDSGSEAIRRTIEGNGFPLEDDDRLFITQELKLNGSAFDNRLNYTVGLFGSTETITDTPVGQLVGPGGIGGVEASFITSLAIPGLPQEFNDAADQGFVVPFAEWLGTTSDLKNESVAVFGEMTYSLTNWLELSLGGRFTRETRFRELSFAEVDTDELGRRLGAVFIPEFEVFSPIPRQRFDAQFDDKRPLPLLPPQSVDEEKVFNEFTPSGTLTFIAPPNWLEAMDLNSLLVYATASQGFKAGGFDTKGQELITVEPEFVTNYELGFKLDGLDKRMRFNGAIYKLDYDDIQLQVNELGDAVTGTEILQFFTNASKATVQGVELETSITFANWFLQANASYTDAEYQEFIGQRVTPFVGTEEPVDRSGEPFFMVPEQKYLLAVMYHWRSPIGMLVPRLEVSFRDELFTGMDVDAIRFDSSTLDSVTLTNFRLAYIPAESLRLTAFVENATDEEYFAAGFSNSGALGANLAIGGLRRSYGLEMNWEF